MSPRVACLISFLGLWIAGCRLPAAEAPPAPRKASPDAPALPPLPREKLPPRTGAPPDPASEQFRRDRVHVHVDEEVVPKEKPPYKPERRFLEIYLAEYFRRAGFEVVEDPRDARYRVDGAFSARFQEPIIFQGLTLAHKYRGQARVQVREGDAPVLETVEIPEFFKDGVQAPDVPEDKVAVLEMRRHLAKVIWERLFHQGKVFADPEIPGLIGSLALDDPDNEAPVQADDVLKALIGKRFLAVPYLIEALSDERVVRVNARYPGLTAVQAEKLRIYHLADKALEEIFQKVSRMDLETPARARFAVIQGWEKEWSRFCPSYRSSPHAPFAPRTADKGEKPAGKEPGKGEAGQEGSGKQAAGAPPAGAEGTASGRPR